MLQHVRNVDHYEKLPFLVIATELTASSLDTTIRQSAEMLGAYGFLQLQKLTNQEAEEQLRKAVREGFNCPVKVVRADSKVRKHG